MASSYFFSTVGETPLNANGLAKLNSLAQSVLKYAEKRDNATMNKYLGQMAELGVTEVYPPQVIAKRTPQCPPIKMELNGKNLSGKLCAKFGYVYKSKTYWRGYCK